MKTSESFPVTIVAERHDSYYQWKRFRVHEEQAQRERKNILQKALLFSRRANQMLVEVRAKISKSVNFLETEHELQALLWIYIMQRSVQDGSLALEADGYRTAFLRSVSEFNEFAGVARYQISEDSALQLFGFKVGFCFEVIDCHMINYYTTTWKKTLFVGLASMDIRSELLIPPGCFWRSICIDTAGKIQAWVSNICHAVSIYMFQL